MDPFPGSCEIVEATEETKCTQHYKGTKPHISGMNVDEKGRNIPKLKFENYHSVEEDLNKLFDAIDLRVSRKSASKKPIRVGSSQGGIGMSECGTLKQALRGLCISHASEMAAMKRVSKPTGLTRVSDAGTMKKIYASMVVGDSESGSLPDKGKQSLVEVSLVPEMRTSSTLKISKSPQTPRTKSSSQCVSSLLTTSEVSITRTSQKDEIENVPSKDGKDKSLLKSLKLQQKGKFKASLSPLSSSPRRSELELDEVVDASTEIGTQTPSLSRSPSGNTLSKISTKNEYNVKQVFINQNIMKKLKQVSTSSPPRHKTGSKSNDVGLEYNSRNMVNGAHNPNQKKVVKESASPAPGNTSLNVVVSSGSFSKPGAGSNNSNDITFSLKVDESSNSREKGGSSQSSKTSSIAEHSNSTTSTSTESYLSGSCYNVSRPHMSKDLKWRAIHEVEMRNGSIGLKHFKLLKRLGCGDIATVYLAELTGTNYLFALKIMDNEFLSNRLKLPRAQTEKEILQMLDHPFLPTLFAHFTTDKFSCLVMEYCPGGDLHILRQIQPSRTFPEQMARFYLAEVLLAMEYLHMLGVVYRDLKPENILVREDGHIMLSDFDLSLRCTVSPKLLKSSSSTTESKKEFSVPCISASCIDPFCPRPSWVQVPCFSPRLTSTEDKSRKLKSHKEVSVNMLPQLVAEPTSARSNSFVGTHEYLAPEIIKAEGHGNEVDWWTFGIFMYELLLGRTPFKGSGNDETLANIVFQSLRFPDTPFISFQAKDLMTKLLVKEPELRLGSVKGATEIRHHPYFEGLNWALVRCAAPPELPILEDLRVASIDSEEIKFMENFQTIEENLELEVF